MSGDEEDGDFMTRPSDPRFYATARWKKTAYRIPTWEFARPGRFGRSLPCARVQKGSQGFPNSTGDYWIMVYLPEQTEKAFGIPTAEKAAFLVMNVIRNLLGPPRLSRPDYKPEFLFPAEDGTLIDFSDFMLGGTVKIL